MPRRRDDSEELPIRVLIDRLGDRGPAGPSPREQLAILTDARAESPDVSQLLDRWLVQEIDGLRGGLAEAQKRQDELRQLHARLTSPPWYAAVFLRPVDSTPDGSGGSPASRALVSYLGSPRVVSLADGVQLTELAGGDDVLLTHDLNVLLRRLTPSVTRASEVAEFHYALGDGRLVLKARESEVIVSAANTLPQADLRTGDRIRWDPAIAMAFEQLPRPAASSFFLADTPADRFANIGGLDRQIFRLQRSVRLHLRHPALVERYQLRRASSVLLVGPPGTGKTMVARALANWLAEEAPGGRVKFMHIKPGALHSMWFSQSEANYREVFRVAREAGAREPGVPVVLFFDEVDAIGLTRGDQGLGRVDDRVLTSFMAELDGLEARGNVLVVAATNRRDALDPALLRPGRLGDLVLEIPRPSMEAARAILERHLPPTVPYADGDEGVPARRYVVDAAVSRLYAPNADGEVAAITFRDGTRRAIAARDLVSGAMLANVARVATESACERELETGDAGIRRTDVLTAVVDELERAVSVLTPANCHAHLPGLPQDLAVARVEPVARATRRMHRMVGAA